MIDKLINALTNCNDAIDVSLVFENGAQSQKLRIADAYLDSENDLCIEGEDGEYCAIRNVKEDEVFGDEVGAEYHVRKSSGADWMFSLPI